MDSEQFILLVLDAFGGSAESETRMQKLAFLATREYGIDLDVSFKWHHYGPYSSELKNKLHNLQYKGLIEIAHEERQTCMNDAYTITKFKLTPRGCRIASILKTRANDDLKANVRGIVNHYGHQELSEILSHVYGAYTPGDL
jgi:uncharacterized protein YwgA